MREGLDNATFAQKRQLVELLVDRVVVTNEDVEIRYVIPTSPDSEQIKFYQLRLDYFYIVLPWLAFVNLVSGDPQATIDVLDLFCLEDTAAIADEAFGAAKLHNSIVKDPQEGGDVLLG